MADTSQYGQPRNDQQVRPFVDQIHILIDRQQDEHNRQLHHLGAINQESQLQLRQARDALVHEQQVHTVTKESLNFEFRQAGINEQKLAVAERNEEELKQRLAGVEVLAGRLAFLLDPRDVSGDTLPISEILQESEAKSRTIADLKERILALDELLGNEETGFLEDQHVLQDHVDFAQKYLSGEAPILRGSPDPPHADAPHNEGEGRNPRRKRTRQGQ